MQVLDLVIVPKAKIVLGIGSQWHVSWLPSQMINDWVIRITLSQNCWVGRVEGTRIGRRRTRRRPRRLRTFNDNSTCAKLRLVQCQIYSDATRCTERNCGKKVTANRISGQCTCTYEVLIDGSKCQEYDELVATQVGSCSPYWYWYSVNELMMAFLCT